MLVRAAGFNCNSHCHQKSKSCANQMQSNCTITGITKREQSTNKKAYKTQPKSGKVPAKKATATSDEKLDVAVKQGKWFGDAHLNEAMKMIQSQFPSLAGFHNSLLGQNLSFPVTNEAFVQILHVERNHWIAIEQISSDCVNTYDSVHSSVSTDTNLQITSLLRTGNERITLKIQKVQFQKRASDFSA